MKKEMSRNGARAKIEIFFKRRDFTAEEVRKMKRLAMKFRIRLKEGRKKFCKKCLSKLRGKTRVTRFYKTVVCENCGFLNKFRI
jgi:RNase P subunit RPR2